MSEPVDPESVSLSNSTSISCKSTWSVNTISVKMYNIPLDCRLIYLSRPRETAPALPPGLARRSGSRLCSPASSSRRAKGSPKIHNALALSRGYPNTRRRCHEHFVIYALSDVRARTAHRWSPAADSSTPRIVLCKCQLQIAVQPTGEHTAFLLRRRPAGEATGAEEMFVDLESTDEFGLPRLLPRCQQ